MSEQETQTEAARTPDVKLPLTRRAMIIFSLVATALFLTAFLLFAVYLRNQTLSSIFTKGRPLSTQIFIGLLLGLCVGAAAVLLLLKASFFARLRSFIGGLVRRIRPTVFDMTLIAVCAGVGEELFFRATLQPAVGLWLASLIFALAHTGLTLTRAALAFAAYVFTMGVILGTLYEQVGLTAAITLHAVYDLIFLLAVKRFLGVEIKTRT